MDLGNLSEVEFPVKGKDQQEIMKSLKTYRNKDFTFNSGRILGSMCTEPLDPAKDVYKEFLESNLGNPGLYPGTKEIEGLVHSIVADLINADGAEALSVGGGTEANIIALWRAREKSGKKKVLLPESAHFSFKKACSLLDMRPEYIPLTDNQRMDVEVLKNKIDTDTAAVIAIAGTTEHGTIDPIEKIGEICEDIHLHVDAAFGGFVIPFLKELGYELPDFDFQIENVNTMTLDPHKMGIAPVPFGLFFSRKSSNISIESPYLTGKNQKGIRGTRASASIPAFWATLNLLGKKGYMDIVSSCMEKTHFLVDKMIDVGFEPITDPTMNIASFHVENPKKAVNYCKENGWHISRTVQPPGLRFVVMPHVTKESIVKIVDLLSDHS